MSNRGGVCMGNDDIWGIIDESWSAITEMYEKYKIGYPTLVFHNDRKKDFDELFKAEYKKVMDTFMTKETDKLDSHKQAALLIICCLKLDIIEHSLGNKDEISIVPQLIAMNIGLSYMLLCLNDRLKEQDVKKKIERYYMPIATACDTPYPEILCRILYQEQHEPDMDFNVLELSDRLFLLEYINLLQYGIEPQSLKKK